MFVYVTGPSASGKSTLRVELMRRGIEAWDGDLDEISRFQDRGSGQPTRRPEDPAARTRRWYAENLWTFSAERLDQLHAHSLVRPVYLCGTAANDGDFRDLFDIVVLLKIERGELVRRLASRKGNDFGATSAERAEVLEGHKSAERVLRRRGALAINAEQPVGKIADQLLALVSCS